MARQRGTGLTDDQAKRLADLLRPYRDERFGGNATDMARAWGVSQSQLSQILSGRGRGAGVAVLIRLRAATGRTLDDLLGLPELGPTQEDRIRAAVERALDERARQGREIVVHVERPKPKLLRPKPTKES